MPRLAIRKPRYGACHRDVRLIDHTADLRTFSPEQEILQEYIQGPEFTVAVLEIDGSPVALPSLSVQFKKPLHIMVSGESDWDMVPAREHKTALSKVACRIFTALNMHDYARIDMRIRDRRIYVLDVNSLPNLDPERSYFPLSAKCAGLTFDRLLACLVRSALLRSALQKKRAKDVDSHVERQ
jgi:D-alanine-D-alanine ligase